MGDYLIQTVRSSAVLTGSYVAGNVVGAETNRHTLAQQNQLVLLIDFTIGSLTTAELKVEFSPDNATFYQECSESVSSGTATVNQLIHQFSATGKYRLAIPMKDAYAKISVKGTGTVTNSLMAISAVCGQT